MRSALSLFLVSLLAFSQPSSAQDIPEQVRLLLDHRFPGWTITGYTIPPGCNDSELVMLDSRAKSFYRCNLNGDHTPDFAVKLATGKDSTFIEYFVALVSKGTTYDPFVLDSCAAFQGAGNRYLFLYPAGEQVPISAGARMFHPPPLGTVTPDSLYIVFPVDGLTIDPICEGYYALHQYYSYIYYRGSFFRFSSFQ